jgi:hypothetical protein
MKKITNTVRLQRKTECRPQQCLRSSTEDEKKERQPSICSCRRNRTHQQTPYWKMPDWGNFTRWPGVPVLKTLLCVNVLENFCFHDDRQSYRLLNVTPSFVMWHALLMKWNKQGTVKTKCHDNRLQYRSPLPIFFLPTGTPGHRVRFPKSGNFVEEGDAVSRFLNMSLSLLHLFICGSRLVMSIIHPLDQLGYYTPLPGWTPG